MINSKMYELGSRRSVIREIFEYGKKRIAEVGAENVFDFSIGNPSVEAPKEVADTARELLNWQPSTKLHGYTSAQGDPNTRKAIAENLNARYGKNFKGEHVYLTCGAAASLTISLRAIIDNPDGSENVMVFAPFFTEYRVFIESMGAETRVVPSLMPSFGLNLEACAQMINSKTVAVIVNSPNNPTGVIYTAEQLTALATLLKQKSAEYGHPIYIISDEPYREIAYDTKTPFITDFYANSLICYSYSKSLSLPGERIGYILVPEELEQASEMYAAICGAGRSLGFICAPAMWQHLITRCCGLTSDLSIYAKNRDLLFNGLTELGFECVHPDGAFYLFVKCMEPDANAFCERAKKHDLLLVPSDDFGCPGYVRIAYCVSADMIKRSMPAFKALAASYQK